MSPSKENSSSFTNGVQMINTNNLFPFPNHPFQVRSDEVMQATIESIKTYGVLRRDLSRGFSANKYEFTKNQKLKAYYILSLSSRY